MKNKNDIVFKILLFLIMIERVYLPKESVTGELNSILLPFTVIIVGVYTINNVEVFKLNNIIIFYSILMSIFISYIFLGGDIKESIRYFLIIILMFFLIQIKALNLKFFFKFTIILGAIFTIYDEFINLTRSTGFLKTSPTLYSLVILIAIVYLLYAGEYDKRDKLLCFLAIFLIFSTGSRSTLIAAVITLSIKYFQGIAKGKYEFIKRSFVILLSVIILIIGFRVINLRDNKYALRENSSESNETRLGFIVKVLENMNENKVSYLIGEGSGASYKITNTNLHIKAPVHQDFLAILCDFGIIGMLNLIAILLIGRYKFTWQGLLLLLVGSFHNLIFYPIGIILIYLTSIAIREKKLEGKSINTG